MNCPQCQSEVVDPAATNCFNCGAALAQSLGLRRGSVIAARYELLEPLGRGGMGVVYKAHDRTLDEHVAIKLLRHEVAAEPVMMRRFRQEIKLARKVRHRNVCGIHEYGEIGDIRYIAMEFIEGVNLRQLLQKQKGGFAPAEGFEICAQVGEGLQAIHDAGIIHRDLKTPNLMRDAQGFVRLMDFGIAKQAGTGATLGATGMGMILGTPEYMSPEQARGGKVDFRSDIYAFGIVVYELFTGFVPFRGETPMETILKHIHDPPPLGGPQFARVPASLVPILHKALAKHPDERYASARDMVAALRLAAATVPIGRTSRAATIGSAAMALAPEAETVVDAGVTPVPAETLSELPTAASAETPERTTAKPASRPSRPPTGPLTAPTLTRPTPPPLPAVTAPWRSGWLVAGAALALLAATGVAGLAWRAWAPSVRATPAPDPRPPSPEPIPPKPTALGPGTVVVNALPWGEVTAVVDEAGRSHGVVGSPFTPVVLTLPPGRYQVKVSNPSAKEPAEITVVVAEGALEQRVVQFRPVDPGAYFKRTGY